MLQRIRAARQKESGFTLIELLIVIVILGILAAIVVFAVGAFQDRGQLSACKADKKNLEVAVEAYRAKFSAYPTSANADAGLASDERIAELVDPDGVAATEDGFLREPISKVNYTIQIADNNGNISVASGPAGC